jgi:hypothetical protein
VVTALFAAVFLFLKFVSNYWLAGISGRIADANSRFSDAVTTAGYCSTTASSMGFFRHSNLQLAIDAIPLQWRARGFAQEPDVVDSWVHREPMLGGESMMSSQTRVADAGTYGEIGAAGVPWSQRIAAIVLNPRTFVVLLVLSTVIPYFIGALTIFHLIGVTWIISFITFLALVHVPMTVYLLSDQDIRAQMLRRRLLMIGGCIFLILISMFVFTAFSVAIGSRHTIILYLFALVGVMWQHWHFGKQNLGVLALSKIATRTGPIAKFERYTVVAGAICGIVAAYLMVGKAFQQSFSPNSDLGFLTSPIDVVSTQFRWFQYVLATLAIGYTVYNFRRFTLATGSLYLLGVCFFLPQFLFIDLPQYFFVFGSFVSAHGTQYIVILFYHSLGSIDLNKRSADVAPGSDQLYGEMDRKVVAQRIMRAARLFSPLIFFALSMAVVINFYTSHSLLSFNDVIAGLVNFVMRFNLGPSTVTGLASGLVWGILLSHFWLDSFFWRLKEKAPREWIKSRYAFLFAGPSR